MAIRLPLVYVNGQSAQLPDGDSLSSVSIGVWTPLTLASSWQGTIEVIAIGSIVFLNGVLNKSTRASNGETISTLPAAFRHTRTTPMRFESIDSNIPTVVTATSKPYLEVDATGKLTYGNYGTIPATTSGLILTTVMFPAV